MIIDLHIHSSYSSDGQLPVAEILDRCISHNIGFFSITDHNSATANYKALELAREKEINFITGIEIDCTYKGTDLHVLGYGINHESEDFRLLEDDIFRKVMLSFDSMIGKLNQLGFPIDRETVVIKADGKQPTGELIAEVMLADEKYYTPLLNPYLPGGERSDMPYINFYLDYFAQDKPAYVPIDFMTYEEAIQIIRDNGGTPIIAHPGLNLKGRESIVEELLERGACGLEVFNNYHSPTQIDYFASVVTQENMLMTCGSDFHGKTKPLIEVGQYNFDKTYERYLHNSVGKLFESL